MKQGMTLLEVLVALSIFTIILWASFSWIRTTAHMSARIAGPARWNLGAESVLQYVQDALSAGDFAHPGGDEESTRIALRDNELTIQTRLNTGTLGPRSVTIRLEESEGNLVLRSWDDESELLLEDVVSFDCHLNALDRSLEVSLSCSEHSVARTLRW